MRLHLLVLLLVLPLLAACTTPTSPPAGDPGLAPPSMVPGPGRAAGSITDAVDYSCTVNADCAVKNVGNCCGHYPACVNRDSPTFPEQVRERCEAEGMMGVCGFPEISACQCVDNRCEAAGGGQQPHRIETE